ncbi:membrane protein [Azospirillum halopraeferens]|uniref:membrane protein n=1 Tax=Azospirillum halopraeferens TaxID=34010 RepID=UPI00040EAB5E|nr:membrane protein [Azospirillum halopraeferens]
MTTGGFVDATSIAFDPLLPWEALAVLFGAAALVLLLGLVRRARGIAWRLLAFAVLAAALLNPSLVHEEREPIRDVAVIVVDDSPSQAVGDRRARAERALSDLTERLERFDDLEVRVVRAGHGAGGEGAINETRLFEALNGAVADVPRRRLAGAVLITDGQVHDIPDSPGRLAEGGPIHTLLTGDRDERDRRLTIVQAPGYGIVGRPVEVTIRVDDLPQRQSATAAVTLRRDGGPPRVVQVPVGRDHVLEMPVDHGGQNVLELEVAAAREELTLANNRAAVVVNGVRDRLRVLLVSGEPHAGERTWRNLLKADPSVDLVHFTILRPPEKQDGTPIRELSLIAFPIRELFEIKLDEFDLIIFDRYRRRGVLPQMYLENIARYVQEGGALLETSGQGYATPLSLFRTPLGEVLPAEPTGRTIGQPFRPVVTELGRRHPVTAGLPGDRADGEPEWGRWFHQVEVQPAGGSVVMTGAEDRPLLILDRVGEGRVAQLASDQIWLWSRGFEGGGPQAELLRRLAHWLMKEPELEENDLRTIVDGNRITVERRSLEPDPRSVTLTAPSDETRTLDMQAAPGGRTVATVVADAPGIYRVTDGERTALAVVGTVNPPELADLRSTGERLAPVAEATGGGIHWIADQGQGGIPVRRTRPDRDQSGDDWIGLRANGDHVVTGVTDVPLLPVAAVLALALATLLLAWRREGR